MNISELKMKLKEEYSVQAELHAHTSPASSCSEVSPEEVVEIYKDLSYDCVTIANHFRYEYQELSKNEVIDQFMNDFERAEKRGNELGIKVILAAEIRFEENENDYLIYGVDRKMMEEIYDLLPFGFDNFCESYKMPNSVFLQAHPFRDDMVRANPKCLDGIEVFNMHPNHNSRVGLASVYAVENNLQIITAGSDFHHKDRKHEGVSAVRFTRLPENSFDLASLLKEKNYLLEVGRSNIILP